MKNVIEIDGKTYTQREALESAYLNTFAHGFDGYSIKELSQLAYYLETLTNAYIALRDSP